MERDRARRINLQSSSSASHSGTIALSARRASGSGAAQPSQLSGRRDTAAVAVPDRGSHDDRARSACMRRHECRSGHRMRRSSCISPRARRSAASARRTSRRSSRSTAFSRMQGGRRHQGPGLSGDLQILDAGLDPLHALDPLSADLECVMSRSACAARGGTAEARIRRIGLGALLRPGPPQNPACHFHGTGLKQAGEGPLTWLRTIRSLPWRIVRGSVHHDHGRGV